MKKPGKKKAAAASAKQIAAKVAKIKKNLAELEKMLDTADIAPAKRRAPSPKSAAGRAKPPPRAQGTARKAGLLARSGRAAPAKGASRASTRKRVAAIHRSASAPPLDASKLNYSLSTKAFAKKYAAGRGGTKKFVLLMARQAKGKAGKKIRVAQIRAEWAELQRAKLFAEFNGLYPNQAKAKGWVRSSSRGVYVLSKNWKNCF